MKGITHVMRKIFGRVLLIVNTIIVNVYARLRVRLSAAPWTVARQAPLSMGFSRQEHWSGLPRPPPGDLPNPGVEPLVLISPALAGEFFTTNITWAAQLLVWITPKIFIGYLGIAAVHGVEKSQIQLSDETTATRYCFHFSVSVINVLMSIRLQKSLRHFWLFSQGKHSDMKTFGNKVCAISTLLILISKL